MHSNKITFSSLKDSSYISISINHQKVRALVDTGAGTTCISKRMVDKLNLKTETLKTGKINQYFTASGTNLNAIGIAKIDFNLNGLIIPFDAVVLLNLSESCIIGVDFLNATSAKLDYSTGTISFEDDLVALHVTPTLTKQDYIRVLADTVLQPNTESIIQVRVAKHFSNVDSLIEPKFAVGKADYQVAKCLVKPQASKTVVQILNFTDKPVSLEKNQRIGLISRLSNDDQIREIDNGQMIASIQPQSENEANNKAEQQAFLDDYKFDINPDLTPEQRDKLVDLLHDYRGIFARDYSEIGCYKGYEVDVETHPHKPYFIRQYKLPPSQLSAAQSSIDELARHGILEPATKSKYNSAYLVVSKKNGGHRLVVDLRRANSITKTWSFNSKSIPDIIEQIGSSNSSWFSNFDCFSGFYLLKLTDSCRDLFTITAPDGLRWRLTRLSMGSVCSMSFFAQMMYQALQTELHSGLNIYADDIACYSRTFDEHLTKLESIFRLFRQNGLSLSPQKSRMAYKDLRMFGFKVSENGIEISSSKTQALQDMPYATSAKSVRRYLGLTNYFRGHIRSYSSRSFHLRKLLCKNVPFNFTEECKKEWDDLKAALASPEILQPINPNEDFYLETDASSLGFGYIFFQVSPKTKQLLPIYFGSSSCNPHQVKYSSNQSELQALYLAVRALGHYLVGRKLFVFTDNISVSMLTNLHLKSNRERRISSYLQSFDLHIMYKPGNQNKADCLSRMYGDLPESERVKFCNQLEDDDKIFAIQKESKEVKEQHEPTQSMADVNNANEANRSESSETTNIHNCTQPNCKCLLCTNCHNDDTDNETEDDMELITTRPNSVRPPSCVDAAIGTNKPQHAPQCRLPPSADVVVDISITDTMDDDEIQHGRQPNDNIPDFQNNCFNAGESTFQTLNSFYLPSPSEREKSCVFTTDTHRVNKVSCTWATPTTEINFSQRRSNKITQTNARATAERSQLQKQINSAAAADNNHIHMTQQYTSTFSKHSAQGDVESQINLPSFKNSLAEITLTAMQEITKFEVLNECGCVCDIVWHPKSKNECPTSVCGCVSAFDFDRGDEHDFCTETAAAHAESEHSRRLAGPQSSATISQCGQGVDQLITALNDGQSEKRKDAGASAQILHTRVTRADISASPPPWDQHPTAADVFNSGCTDEAYNTQNLLHESNQNKRSTLRSILRVQTEVGTKPSRVHNRQVQFKLDDIDVATTSNGQHRVDQIASQYQMHFHNDVNHPDPPDCTNDDYQLSCVNNLHDQHKQRRRHWRPVAEIAQPAYSGPVSPPSYEKAVDLKLKHDQQNNVVNIKQRRQNGDYISERLQTCEANPRVMPSMTNANNPNLNDDNNENTNKSLGWLNNIHYDVQHNARRLISPPLVGLMTGSDANSSSDDEEDNRKHTDGSVATRSSKERVSFPSVWGCTGHPPDFVRNGIDHCIQLDNAVIKHGHSSLTTDPNISDCIIRPNRRSDFDKSDIHGGHETNNDETVQEGSENLNAVTINEQSDQCAAVSLDQNQHKFSDCCSSLTSSFAKDEFLKSQLINDASNCDNADVIKILQQLPSDISEELMAMDCDPRHAAILNNYRKQQDALACVHASECINAVTRAQANKMPEASKQDTAPSEAIKQNHAQSANIHANIPKEYKLNNQVTITVNMQEPRKIPTTAFACQTDNKLEPNTDISRRIRAHVGKQIQQQCHQYIMRHGSPISPELVVTKRTDDKNGNIYVLHIVDNLINVAQKERRHETILLYIMALSLADELKLDSLSLELLRHLPLNDSLDCLNEAINAISLQEDGTRTDLSIKRLILMPNNIKEAEQINDLLTELTGKSQQIHANTHMQSDDKSNDRQSKKLSIKLCPQDYISDPFYGDIYVYLSQNKLPDEDKLARDTILKAERMFISDDKLLYHLKSPRSAKKATDTPVICQRVIPDRYVELLLQYCHIISGHASVDILYANISQKYTFRNAYQRTLDHTRQCHVCSYTKSQYKTPIAHLRPVRTTGLFEDLSVDLITYGQRDSYGKQNLLVAIEYLTNYVILVPLRTASAIECFEVLIDRVFTRVGVPRFLHLDRGSSWMGPCQEGIKRLGIQMKRSSSRNCRANAKSERVIKDIHQKFRSFGATRETWSMFTGMVEYALNTNTHSRLGLSAFEMVFSVPPRFAIENILGADEEPDNTRRFDVAERIVFENTMRRVNRLRDIVRQRRKIAEEKYTKYYNARNRTEKPNYTLGQLVYLERSDVRPHKFSSKYHDKLYEITRLLDSDTYGQLVQLTDVNTKKPVDSLIHTNRIKLALDQAKTGNEIKPRNTNPELVEVTGGKSPGVMLTDVIDDLNHNKSQQQSSSPDNTSTTTNVGTANSSGPANAIPGAVKSATEDRTTRIFYGRPKRPGRRPY